MKVMLLTAASALSRFNGVLRSGYSRDQWWWREIALPGFFQSGQVGWKIQSANQSVQFRRSQQTGMSV